MLNLLGQPFCPARGPFVAVQKPQFQRFPLRKLDGGPEDPVRHERSVQPVPGRCLIMAKGCRAVVHHDEQ